MSKLFKILLTATLFLQTISPTIAPTAIAFNDLDQGDKYYVAISYLQENGIIQGYPDQTFRANQPITKAEALKMSMHAFGFSVEPIENAEWFAPYAALAAEKNIINDDNPDNFHPHKKINLAETLKILLESYQPDHDYLTINENLFADTPAEEWFTPYTSYAGSKTIINVYLNNNINPEQEMTRGYFSEILYRLIKSAEGFEFGQATFYGKAVQGSGTASGETFDYNKLTAAHRTLPFGTIVRVTNLNNGKTVDVEINDRGPHGAGRIIDLSEAAFAAIASLGAGVIPVQYQVITP